MKSCAEVDVSFLSKIPPFYFTQIPLQHLTHSPPPLSLSLSLSLSLLWPLLSLTSCPCLQKLFTRWHPLSLTQPHRDTHTLSHTQNNAFCSLAHILWRPSPSFFFKNFFLIIRSKIVHFRRFWEAFKIQIKTILFRISKCVWWKRLFYDFSNKEFNGQTIKSITIFNAFCLTLFINKRRSMFIFLFHDLDKRNST